MLVKTIEYSDVTKMVRKISVSLREYVHEHPRMIERPYLEKRSKTDNEDSFVIVYDVLAHDKDISQYGRRARHRLYSVTCVYNKTTDTWSFESLSFLSINNKHEENVFRALASAVESFYGFKKIPYTVSHKTIRNAKFAPENKPKNVNRELVIHTAIRNFLYGLKKEPNEWLRDGFISMTPNEMPTDYQEMHYTYKGKFYYPSALTGVSVEVTFDRKREIVSNIKVVTPMMTYDTVARLTETYLTKLMTDSIHFDDKFEIYPNVELIYKADCKL